MPSSTTESSGINETIQNAPGVDVFGGFLRDLFGQNQYLSQGQLIMGDVPEYIEMTDEEIRHKIKALGADPIGYQDPRRNTPEQQEAREAQFARIQESERQKFMQKHGFDVSGQFADAIGTGTPGDRTGFSAIADLFEQQNPFAEDFMDIIRQAAQNQGNLFALGNTALSDFLEEGGRAGIDAMVDRGLADIKEQFSAQGQLYSSDLNAEVLRRRAEEEALGQNRLLAAVGLAGDFGNQQLGFGSGLLDVGSQYERQATAPGRAHAIIQSFMNPQSTNPFSMGADSYSGQFSKTKTSSNFLDAIGQLPISATYDIK